LVEPKVAYLEHYLAVHLEQTKADSMVDSMEHYWVDQKVALTEHY
jgi:hypothetical protein